LRLLRQEVSSREERDRDIKTRVSSLVLDRDAFREAYNEAMGELKEKDDEVATLREQVRGLKSWVSTSSRGEEQVTDESFGEGWRRLGNGLQNWVIVNFRRAKIGMFVYYYYCCWLNERLYLDDVQGLSSVNFKICSSASPR